ncbi:MAG: hypothetical protein IJ730_04715, partial [Alphaproteobacteria bacterium]|nr:hypothetical protein [Alphaproteobacteria bacterium]MBR2137526.1 hypothetical protein [Alphaproteobacteria bacterium]
ISEKNVAVEKAHKIGIEKGRAEERAKAEAEKQESAKTALSMGLTVEQTSKITGLSLEEVNKIKEKIQ